MRGMKGLVIDDNPIILNIVFKYLKHQGCEIMIASDVKTALNLVKGKDFDFVICDIKMQGLGGPDFYRIVQEKKPSLKDCIIFATGDVQSDSTKAFIDSVTNPYIEKPFSLNELKEIIIKTISISKGGQLTQLVTV